MEHQRLSGVIAFHVDPALRNQVVGQSTNQTDPLGSLSPLRSYTTTAEVMVFSSMSCITRRCMERLASDPATIPVPRIHHRIRSLQSFLAGFLPVVPLDTDRRQGRLWLRLGPARRPASQLRHLLAPDPAGFPCARRLTLDPRGEFVERIDSNLARHWMPLRFHAANLAKNQLPLNHVFARPLPDDVWSKSLGRGLTHVSLVQSSLRIGHAIFGP